MYFIYKGRSSEEFGIKIIKSNYLSSPEKDIKVVEVDGRNGDLIIDKGRFKNVELKFECDIKTYLVNKTLMDVAKEMKKWLQADSTYGELIISENENSCYEANYVGNLDIEQVVKNFGVALLKFNCKPLKRMVVNKLVNINQQNTLIFNPGYPSNPIIKVIGSGDCTININNQKLILKSLEGEIIVDCDMVNAYKIDKLTGNRINQNQKMFSDFPVLGEGDNNITWAGNISKIEITPNFVELC